MEIVAAYRRLAMRWHPDRNRSAEATIRFQEIQTAYQILQARHAPRNVRQLWAEMRATGEEDYSQRIGAWHDNFPFAAASCLGAGALAFAFLTWPGDWMVLSLSLIGATSFYKTGSTIFSLRAESGFRLAVRCYWVGLLAWAVVSIARRAALTY